MITSQNASTANAKTDIERMESFVCDIMSQKRKDVESMFCGLSEHFMCEFIFHYVRFAFG